MTINTVGEKFTHEKAGQNSKIPPSPQKAASSAPPAVPRSIPSIQSLIASAGLPADKLSASVIAFSRFFSLPLKPELMTSIRRQAFSQSDTAVKNGESIRETLSLAAAAAESKGIELEPKALLQFAKYIDPDLHEEDPNNRQNNGNKQDENNQQKTDVITAANLKKTALEYSEKDQLLNILNKLPIKNGQRWIVMPFEFTQDNSLFKVSLRVLVDIQQSVNRTSYMVLDIKESGDSEQHSLFVLEAMNNKPCKLSVHLPETSLQVKTELSAKERASLIDILSSLLEIPKEHITIKNLTEPFPFEAGDIDNQYSQYSIDETV